MNQSITKESNVNGLIVSTSGRQPSLTRGQKGLVDLIVSCIEQKSPLDWDVLVLCYYENVRKKYFDKYKFQYVKSGDEASCEYDILTEYQKRSGTWQYSIKPSVRSWFLSTIGALVLKNKLIVVPVIELK